MLHMKIAPFLYDFKTQKVFRQTLKCHCPQDQIVWVELEHAINFEIPVSTPTFRYDLPCLSIARGLCFGWKKIPQPHPLRPQ